MLSTLTCYFQFVWYIFLSHSSVVGIATGYGLDNWEVGVWVPVRSRILTSPYCPDWQPSIQWVPGDFSAGVKQQGPKANYSPPTGARGSIVVKAVCYKPEGRGFDSQCVTYPMTSIQRIFVNSSEMFNNSYLTAVRKFSLIYKVIQQSSKIALFWLITHSTSHMRATPINHVYCNLNSAYAHGGQLILRINIKQKIQNETK
jgi:hypothetical protein